MQRSRSPRLLALLAVFAALVGVTSGAPPALPVGSAAAAALGQQERVSGDGGAAVRVDRVDAARVTRSTRRVAARWVVAKPTTVRSLRIAAVRSTSRMRTGVVRFSDGTSVKVRAKRDGSVSVRFAPRKVRSAVLVVTSTRGAGAVVKVGRLRVVAVPGKRAASPSAGTVGGDRVTPTGSQSIAPSITTGPVGGSVGGAVEGATEASAPEPARVATSEPPVAVQSAREAAPEIVTQQPIAAAHPVASEATAAPTATVTASTASGVVRALTDADRLPSATGASWTAPTTGAQEVTLTWSAPTRIATLQIYGSPTAGGGVSASSATFSDGTTLRLLPVPAGAGAPATVAFTPRTVTSATVRLVPRTSAPVQLREIVAFAPGVLAPAGGTASTTAVQAATPASQCGGVTAGATSNLRLVCPSTGQTLRSTTQIVVSGPEGAVVTASAVGSSGSSSALGSATVVRGTAVFGISSNALPTGPVAIRFKSAAVAKPLTAQFVNAVTAVSSVRSSAAASGRTLVFADDFDGALSASTSGIGTTYAATKPASWGGSEFGDAVFSDPARHPQNISVQDGGYLRLRTTPLQAGETDPNGWGRTIRGGILSSASINGGFAAQHGYFETRMLAPAAPGTWPAFWMMSSGFLEDSQSSLNSEVDAVELYGQDSGYSCHSWHDWRGVATKRGDGVQCISPLNDWSDTFHTYGVDIAASGTKYYIDGRLVASAPAVENAADPFFFMTNLSAGGGWPIDLTGVGGVTDLYVDYIRVYV